MVWLTIADYAHMLSFTVPQDGTSTIWEYLKGDLVRIRSVCAFISHLLYNIAKSSLYIKETIHHTYSCAAPFK